MTVSYIFTLDVSQGSLDKKKKKNICKGLHVRMGGSAFSCKLVDTKKKKSLEFCLLCVPVADRCHSALFTGKVPNELGQPADH